MGPALTIAIVALVLAACSLALGGIAYWRAGGRSEVMAMRARLAEELDRLKQKEREVAEELAYRIRSGYEDSLARIKRAQERLAEMREGMSASVRHSIDILTRQLAELRAEAEAALEKLKTGASSGAQAAHEALARRVRRLEARVQILAARTEMVRAERLAEKRDFRGAEELLEDAVAKVQEARARGVGDDFEKVPAFTNVIRALA